MTTRGARADWIALVTAVLWTLAAALARSGGAWLSFGSAAIFCGVLIVVAVPAVRPRLEPRPRQILIGALAAGVLIAGTYLLHPLVAGVGWIARDLERLYAELRALRPLVAALAIVPVVVGEELVWRGAVQGALEPRAGRLAAALLATAAYGLAHAPTGSPLLVLTALACGLVWTALRAATGSLVPSLVSHLGWDALVLLWHPLVPR